MSGDTRREAVVEADVSASMIARVSKLLERAEHISSMPQADLDAMGAAQREGLAHEAEACNQRAAEIIAKYGIDRAMLAASGKLADAAGDKVIMAERPFASKMQDLLAVIAEAMGAKVTRVKTWNEQSGPKAKGGVPRGGYDYGLRVFAWESDLERIGILYASLRNQALSGVSKVVNKDETFGQAQKADRESYLDGWVGGVWRKLRQAEREAAERAEAQEQEARDQALLSGQGAAFGPGVALVLADRRSALNRAYDLARGITPELRAQWKADSEASAKRWEEQREQRRAEIAACTKCQKAKSGRCNEHRERSYGRSYRSYERTGTRYGDGYADGLRADIGGGVAVSSDTREIG